LSERSSSQRQLSSSRFMNQGRLVISDNRSSSVSNLKLQPSISKEAITAPSKHKQNTNQDLGEKQSKSSESESKTSSSKSSQSVISDAKEIRIIDETKRPDSVWSSLLSNIGISPDKTPAPLPACPEIPPGLQGRISLNLGILPLSQVAAKLPRVGQGGEGKPINCTSNHQVAVIVPYRERPTQLAVFLRNLHPMLIKQQLHYRIYLVNQTDSNTFNRAMLMNVGFVEAMKDHNWTCAIFHDVDLLPEDDRNLYSCPEQPRHLSVAVDKFKYRLPYKGIFGGATAVRADQFRKLNGYSNMFWGWGGEDDDMSKRISHHKMKIIRYQNNIARYTMIKHKQEKANKMRQSFLSSSHKRYNSDGLNSLSYSLAGKHLMPLYTELDVRLERSQESVQKEIEAERRGERRVKHKPVRHPAAFTSNKQHI